MGRRNLSTKNLAKWATKLLAVGDGTLLGAFSGGVGQRGKERSLVTKGGLIPRGLRGGSTTINLRRRSSSCQCCGE